MKGKDEIDELSELLDSIQVTEENFSTINKAKEYIQQGDYKTALEILKDISKKPTKSRKSKSVESQSKETPKAVESDNIYPKEISSTILEEHYIGMLLNDLKSIVKYYIMFDDCYFADPRLLEIYKMIFRQAVKP